MKRKVVLARNDYADFVNAQNNRTNVYTTVYDFEYFSEKAKIDSSVILDRIFLDFDAHEEPLEKAFRDVKVVLDLIIEQDFEYTLFFSGRGFHMFIFGEVVEDMRSIQTFFREIKQYLISKVGSSITLDDRVGQTTRLRRVPNTVNMSSSDENGNPYYCIPLLEEDLSNDVSHILSLASSMRVIPFRKSGKIKAKFPDAPPIEAVGGEVSVPEYTGKTPILPCLHSAVMVENPSHMARVYLVSWYRDMLTLRRKLTTIEEKEKVLELIVEEIKELVENNEEIWLDWNEHETRKHARFTVFGNYKTPNCKTVLIPNGYCIGKCWRYPTYLDKED
tara:strand:+ start:144 stop:1142 length:999 start_codon:yes stop_codon:yes gene_type:complete